MLTLCHNIARVLSSSGFHSEHHIDLDHITTVRGRGIGDVRIWTFFF